MTRVLLVDDEPRSLDAMEMALEEVCEVRRALSAEEALEVLAREKVDAVLSDQRMPGMSGVDLLAEIRMRDPMIGRMIVTGYTDPEDVIAAINRAGIQRFIRKPWHPEELVEAVCKVAGCTGTADDPFAAIVHDAASPVRGIVERARILAPFSVPVLILGEAGAGHALLASAMAEAGERRPFRSLSVFDEEAARSAIDAREGGTLHLRDLDRASPALQAHLLDLLGSRDALAPRILASIGPGGLESLLPELRYGLAVEMLELPALRMRRCDIVLLAEHYRRQAEEGHGVATRGFSPQARDALLAHDWPGNLRELESAVIRGVLLAEGGAIEPAHLRLAGPAAEEAGGKRRPGETAGDGEAGLPAAIEGRGTLRAHVAALEVQLIREALARHGGNKSRAAEELGISRVGLRAKLERYGISAD